MSKDYYNILGLDKYSTQEEIKKGYKKLALKYHPDKNKNNEECKIKFCNITEAYNVLNTDEKKKRYDMFGNMDENDLKFDEDPFQMFNSIFTEHLNQFNSKKTENSFDIGGIINKLSGFNIETMFGSSSNPGDIFNTLNSKLNDNNDRISNILNNLNINPKMNLNSNTDSDLIKEVVDDIVIHLNVSICDIYNNKKRKVSYEKNKYKKGELIKKKVNLEIELNDKEIILKGNGNETLNKKGDVCIYLHCDKNDYVRINDYDIFYEKKIIFKDFYLNKIIEITLPNEEVLYLQNVKGNRLIKINKKGIKYQENDETYNGNLYCYFSINMPEIDVLYDIVNEIVELEDSIVVNEKEYTKYSYVTSYDIFNVD